MNISPVSFQGATSAFPVVAMGKDTPDDAIVAWGRTDNEDIYPLTAGQIRDQFEATQRYIRHHIGAKAPQNISENQDSNSWYENKVKYSNEWAN